MVNNACCRQGRVWPLSREDYDDNEEAKGYVAISGGRGPIVIYSALFAIVALNAFASALADCDGNVLDGSLKASSVVSTIATAEGIINAIVSPFFGGYADATPHRRPALGITFAMVLATLFLQSILFLSTDHPEELLDPATNNTSFLQVPIEPFYNNDVLILLAVIFIAQSIIYELSALLATSYSAELTTDDVKQTGYIADSFVANNGAQLILIVVLIGVVFVAGFNNFESGTYGGFITLAWCTIVFTYGFRKMGNRHEVDPELDTRFFGVIHLGKVLCAGLSKYPDLFKFLFSWMFVAAAVSSSVALATTYFQFHLNFQGLTVQALLGTALVFSVPGAALSRVWVKKFGVSIKRLYIVVATIYGSSFLIAPFLLTSSAGENITSTSQFGKCPNPNGNSLAPPVADGLSLPLAGVFVVLWGLLLGHIYPMNIAIYSQLIPGGEESSWFGIKVTFSKVLTFLPPLLFTIINEGGSLQFAVMPVGGMFILGAFIACFIDMDAGVAAVADTLHKRRGVGVKDPNARRDTLAVDISESLDKQGI